MDKDESFEIEFLEKDEMDIINIYRNIPDSLKSQALQELYNSATEFNKGKEETSESIR